MTSSPFAYKPNLVETVERHRRFWTRQMPDQILAGFKDVDTLPFIDPAGQCPDLHDMFNAWDTNGPWIPPGRLDLAGEYLHARLSGVAEGPAHRDLLGALSVPASDATPEERELAMDIRSMLAARARRVMSA